MSYVDGEYKIRFFFPKRCIEIERQAIPSIAIGPIISQKRLKVKLETDKKETPSESSKEMSSNDSNGNHESKHNHTGKDAAASLTAEISPLLLESKATLSVDGEWNATDQTMFRELRKVYLNNYCVIAKIMRTKTCEQVSSHR